MSAIEPGPSRLKRLLRHAPRPGDLPAVAGVAAARLLMRRPQSAGRGFVSDEAPVIVAGMHRSGTSIFTELLELGGAYVGGTWLDENHESVFFSRANRAMLGEAPYLLHDYGWTAPKTDGFIAARRGYAERAARDPSAFFAERRGEMVWAWKDPRNSLTLPVWLSVYPNARVLHTIRDGRAVALSLSDRDGLDPAFGLALWAVYASRAARALEPLPDDRKLTLRYEDLTADPVPVIERLYAFAGLQPSRPLDEIASRVKPERTAARETDPAFAAVGEHPLLDAYGYR